MKRFRRFLKDYRLFVFALLMALVAILLGIANYHTAAYWLLTSVSLLEVCPMLWNVWQDYRAGNYGIDILTAIAIITAVTIDQVWTAILLVLLKTGSKSIENYAFNRAKRELYTLQKHTPSTAHLIQKGKIVDVSAKEIKAGEKVLIKAGETVPVDALIMEGKSFFDESLLTGDRELQLRQVNDVILSGALCIDGPITAKARTNFDDSQYEQNVRFVRNAASAKSPFVRLTARYSLPYTFSAFAIAATAGLISGQAVRFLEVIVVATPVPLLLAAPIALISGLSRTTRYGIIVKSGTMLEQLSDTQTLAFNKTGTLTFGYPQIENIITFGSYNQSEVLGLAASLEQNTDHPLSQAIIDESITRNIKLLKAKHVREFPGLGLRATLKNRIIVVGRSSLLEQEEVSIPVNARINKIKQTAVYVAVDSTLVGIITLQDELQPDSLPALTFLHKRGIRHMVLLTGDNDRVAKAIAKQLNIEHTHADITSANKLHALEDIKRRPLVFVGDGEKDAPAITAADVGITIGAWGKTTSSEHADIIILSDHFSRVATAYEISRRTLRIAMQSVLLGVILSLLLMLVYASGKLAAISGVFAQEIVVILVIFNSLRAHFGKVTDFSLTSEDQ